jgi:hypothetical protein
MRFRLVFLFLAFVSVDARCAEPAAPQPLQSIYIARSGERLVGPHVFTYHLLEYSLARGRWIFPDIGYYDEGHAEDHQWFAGAGAELYHSQHLVWTQELYLAQEAGSAAHYQRTLWVWPVLDLEVKPRLTGQVVVYPTVPLDRAARWGFDVDRAKLEYAVRPHLQAGVGYSATTCAGKPWQNMPFLTATLTNRSGAWEVWLERMPGGAQLQLRYQLAYAHR